MDRDADADPAAKTTMQEYRKQYREQAEERTRTMRTLNRNGLLNIEILHVLVTPRSVDMREFQGSDQEMAREIEYLYTNDGLAFNPTLEYPPGMLDRYGKEYALNARGIYYHNDFSPELVTVSRKVWVPSLEAVDWEEPGEWDRRKRARILMEHNINNETRYKSEYAWEADAWANVFNGMRNDPYLEIDKHDYFTELAKTDPVRCTLTGESTTVKRTPDATIGLATFSEDKGDLLAWTDGLRRERLEKLLLHRKCGLVADPKWGETDLVFPFAVYEAKGWSGDCREARRQACEGAVCYLDMLDNLARTPGPVGSTKPYQTATSHQYQVFALTSFGAHWHLLVGYRRPRQLTEHCEKEGLSETVYVFQRIWSARVVDERSAWELLSLCDQIHLWAITDFRTFVLEHLKPWHKFCDDNYILDWKSVYDISQEPKWTRTCSEAEDLPLPRWTDLLSKPARHKVQERAKKSLAKALEKHRHHKGKGRCQDNSSWRCLVDECSKPSETLYTSDQAWLDHLRSVHHYPESDMKKIYLCLKDEEMKMAYIEEKEGKGKGKEKERLIDSVTDAHTRNSKRCFDDEGGNDNFQDSFSGNDPGPSKRVRVE